jgi:hypothetical protein
VRWLILFVLGDVLTVQGGWYVGYFCLCLLITVQGGWCVGYFCLCLLMFLQCKVDGALVASDCVR